MKLAVVALSTSTVTITQTLAEWLTKFLGGRGLGAKLSFDHVGRILIPSLPTTISSLETIFKQPLPKKHSRSLTLSWIQKARRAGCTRWTSR